MPKSNYYKASIGDSVMVSYKGYQYPAKILDQRPMSLIESHKKGKWEEEYFVHYIRWNKKWDEWIPASRITQNTSQTTSAKPIKINLLSSVIEIPKEAKRKRTGLVDKDNSDNDTALSSSVVYARVSNIDTQAALKLLELSEPKRILTKLDKNPMEQNYFQKTGTSKKLSRLTKSEENLSVKKDFYFGTRPIAVPRKKRVTDKQIFTASSSVHTQDENFSQKKSFSCSISDQENSVTTVQKNSDNMRLYIG